MTEPTDSQPVRTLRDRFPIYCERCGQKIANDEDYRVIGLRMDSDRIPTCVYAHKGEIAKWPL